MLRGFQYLRSKIKPFFVGRTPDKIEFYVLKYLSRDKEIILVDIGAHKGDFVDAILRHFKIEKALLVEPISQLAEFLRSKYSDSRYLIFNNVVSDIDYEMASFYINEYEETSSLLSLKADLTELSNVKTTLLKTENILSRTLDSLAIEGDLEEIDLLKIDVQGAEHLVLLGGNNVLKSCKFIWVELSFKPLYVGSSVFPEIYSFLEERNFVLLELSPGHRSPKNELLQADALFGNSKYL
jgi:FkbM family methyltransferase